MRARRHNTFHTQILLLAAALACVAHAAHGAAALAYRVVQRHPHDAQSFTQGLAWHDGRLIESTGGYGRSTLSVREIADGRVVSVRRLPDAVFGEGVALLAGEIFQLTWQSGRAFVYDLDLTPRRELRYRGEGWGLTHDGAHLWLSDGSAQLQQLEPRSFAPVRAITVRDGDRPVTQLNELEWANGLIYANVWHTDRIAVIEPASGRVRAWLDLATLRMRFAPPPGWDPQEHVLNGIAHDPGSGHFFVTGKCWPALFEIEIAPP